MVSNETENGSARSLMEYSGVAWVRQSSRWLSVGQFGLLATKFPRRAGNCHALAAACADEIGPELGEGIEAIEKHLAIGSSGA